MAASRYARAFHIRHDVYRERQARESDIGYTLPWLSPSPPSSGCLAMRWASRQFSQRRARQDRQESPDEQSRRVGSRVRSKEQSSPALQFWPHLKTWGRPGVFQTPGLHDSTRTHYRTNARSQTPRFMIVLPVRLSRSSPDPCVGEGQCRADRQFVRPFSTL